MKAKQVLGCLLSAAMVTSCLPGTAFAAGAANKPTDGGKEAVKADDTAGKIVSETTEERIKELTEESWNGSFSVKEKLQQWRDFYENDFSSEAIEQFDKIIEELE